MRFRLPRLWSGRRRRNTATALDTELDVAHREADRAILDAVQLHCRADDVADRLARTRARNNIAEAVEKSIRRARHT
jgi:hypothetical protein